MNHWFLLGLTLAIEMLPFYGLSMLVGIVWPIRAGDQVARRRFRLQLIIFGAIGYINAVIFLTRVFSPYLVGCAFSLDRATGGVIRPPEPAWWMYGLGCRTNNALIDGLVVAVIPVILMLLSSRLGGAFRQAYERRQPRQPE